MALIPLDQIMAEGHLWAVAFIDLLGQREAMREIDFEIDFALNVVDSQAMERFETGADKVFGATRRLQRRIEENWIRHYEDKCRTTPVVNVPNASKALQQQLCLAPRDLPPPFRVQHFSDGLVVFMPLGVGCSIIGGILALLGSSASALLEGIINGEPIRGGIEIGLGRELCSGELYGPVMAHAYELESKVAQYPRIVVGKQCVKYIRTLQHAPDDDAKARADRDLVNLCADLLFEDEDGWQMVDFLGRIHREGLGEACFKGAASAARKYVLQQLEKFQCQPNNELAKRYAQLLRYFEDRLAGVEAHT